MKPFKTYSEADENLSELEDWEVEFHSRFGGEKFLPYIDPSRVRQFARKIIDNEKEQMITDIEEKISELTIPQGKELEGWTDGEKITFNASLGQLLNFLYELKTNEKEKTHQKR